MNVSEDGVAMTWVYTKLAAVSGITSIVGASGVYRGTVTAGVAPPYVMVQYFTGSDMTAKDSIRVMTTVNLLVKAVTQEDEAGSDALQDLIDSALSDKHEDFSTAPQWRIDCKRLMPFRSEPYSGNRLFREAGGRYEVKVRKYV